MTHYQPADLPKLLGRARELTAGYQAGGEQAFEAYRELLNFIFRLTVMDASAGVRVHRLKGDDVKRVIAPLQGPQMPLPLNGGAFLRFNINAFLGDTAKAPGRLVLKIADEAFQYQLDDQGTEWIFRYEYQRDPAVNRHPPAHLHVKADLKRGPEVFGDDHPLDRVHFPTGRVSVPAIIRLLVEQFGVPCHEDPELWRPVLAQVESDFHEIAHQPLSGPDR
jgi:hypothetical protein